MKQDYVKHMDIEQLFIELLIGCTYSSSSWQMISRRTAWHAELKVVILYSKTFLTDLPGLVWSGSSLCRLDLVKIDLDLVWRFSLIKIRRFLHCTAFCNPSFTVVFTGALLPVLRPAKFLVLVLCRIASSSQPDIHLIH